MMYKFNPEQCREGVNRVDAYIAEHAPAELIRLTETRSKEDSLSIARTCFCVDELPQGAFARYVLCEDAHDAYVGIPGKGVFDNKDGEFIDYGGDWVLDGKLMPVRRQFRPNANDVTLREGCISGDAGDPVVSFLQMIEREEAVFFDLLRFMTQDRIVEVSSIDQVHIPNDAQVIHPIGLFSPTFPEHSYECKSLVNEIFVLPTREEAGVVAFRQDRTIIPTEINEWIVYEEIAIGSGSAKQIHHYKEM